MDKKTKMWIGVAVVAAVAYYFWEKSAKDAASDAAKAPATTTTTPAVKSNYVGMINTERHPVVK